MSLFSRERYQINRTRTYKRKHRFLSSNYCLLRISPLKKVFERSLYTPRSCNHDKYKELKLLLLNVSTYGLKELLPSFANNIHISHTSGPKRKKKDSWRNYKSLYGNITTALRNKKNTVKFSINIPYLISTVHRLFFNRLL